MITYNEDIFNYNSISKEFKRFGHTSWQVAYTATAVIVNGKFMRVCPSIEYTLKLRKDGIYSSLSPKELVRQIVANWACKDFANVFANRLCRYVYRYGKELPKLKTGTLYRCVNGDKEFFCPSAYMASELIDAWFSELTQCGYDYHNFTHLGDNITIITYSKSGYDRKIIFETI